MNKEKLETIFNDDLGTSYFPLLAEEYLKDEDYERALKVLDIGILLSPDNNDGKYIKAKIAMIHSDTKTAVSLLNEILNSDELYVNAMRMLVLYHQSTGTTQTSMVKVLHQILDLFPGDEFATGIIKTVKTPRKKTPITSKPQPKKQPEIDQINQKIARNSNSEKTRRY